VIHGIAFGVVTTILAAVAIAALPEGRRGEGTSYFSLSQAAATAIGPFLALYVILHSGSTALFVCSVACSVVALLSTAFARIPEANLTPEQKADIKKSVHPKDFLERKALPITLVLFIGSAAASSVISFINLYAIEIDLTKAASFFFAVEAAFLFVSRPIAGRLFDAKGENTVMYPAFLLFSVCFVILAAAQNGFMLLLAGVFLAFGFGTLLSSIQAIVVKVTPPDHLALGISTYFISLDAGTGVGAYVIGLIVQALGFRLMYAVLAAVALCLIPLYYFVHGRSAGRSQYAV
jgi:predicted MFS family arabinose efflux permease